MAVVYHWKHGWIPLDHQAALSKAKGNHERATALLSAAHGHDAGINSRRDVAKALTTLHDVPTGDRDTARHEVIHAAVTHNATDLLPDRARQRAQELRDRAQQLRNRADGIAAGAGVNDRAAARTSGRALAQAHRNTDSSLAKYVATTQAANKAESSARRLEAKADEASRTKFTDKAQLAGVTHVQDLRGELHQVVRVNAKTVTVKTPYSWTDNIPLHKIKAALKPNGSGKHVVVKP